MGPSGLHYIIGPLQMASGPRKKEKTAMSHFWDTHHTVRVPKMRHARFLMVSHITARGQAAWGARNCRLASIERASPDSCLADNTLIPGSGSCSVDVSDSPDLGASLFQVVGDMVRVPRMRCGGFFFFSRPTGHLQRSDNVM